jgi:hypothetical protein
MAFLIVPEYRPILQIQENLCQIFVGQEALPVFFGIGRFVASGWGAKFIEDWEISWLANGGKNYRLVRSKTGNSLSFSGSKTLRT